MNIHSIKTAAIITATDTLTNPAELQLSSEQKHSVLDARPEMPSSPQPADLSSSNALAQPRETKINKQTNRAKAVDSVRLYNGLQYEYIRVGQGKVCVAHCQC